MDLFEYGYMGGQRFWSWAHGHLMVSRYLSRYFGVGVALSLCLRRMYTYGFVFSSRLRRPHYSATSLRMPVI